jgi:hypothetical protein
MSAERQLTPRFQTEPCSAEGFRVIPKSSKLRLAGLGQLGSNHVYEFTP